LLLLLLLLCCLAGADLSCGQLGEHGLQHLGS
jgi:hypothetical protein